jgi:uncharacterized protein (UPF0332 family)
VTYAKDLLTSAKKLLSEVEGTLPSASDCNRAVSTAYYAVFDSLCQLCANHLVGPIGSGSADNAAWVRAYRSLDHKQISEALNKIVGLDETTQRFVVSIGSIFKSCLEARNEADYNRDRNYKLREATRVVNEAEVVLIFLKDPYFYDIDDTAFDRAAFAKALTVELFSRKRR